MAYLAHTRFSGPCSFARLLIVLLMTVSSAAFAQHPGCDQTDSATVSTGLNSKTGPDSSTSSGLRVFIDPQTGELLSEPPPGTAAAVDAPAAGPRPELVEEIRPDGSVMVRLDDRFQFPLQAEVKGDQLVTCHGDHPQHD